jgi:putative membrane protein
MGFLVRIVVNGIAIWVAQALVPGITLVGTTTVSGTVVVLLVIGLVFGLVNAVVKPVVAILSIPLYVLTLGLFTLVVNAGMLALTATIAKAVGIGLTIDSFWAAVLGALIVSVVSVILSGAARRAAED